MAARVLIVDDDEDYRASVRAVLEAQGYEVLEAESGSEGFLKLVSEKPNAIVLDVMMKCCCEGYGFTWALRNKEEYTAFRHTPVIMTSSIEESPDDRFSMCPEAELIRPDYYFTKPLDFPRFLKTVEQAIAPAVVCAAGRA